MRWHLKCLYINILVMLCSALQSFGLQGCLTPNIVKRNANHIGIFSPNVLKLLTARKIRGGSTTEEETNTVIPRPLLRFDSEGKLLQSEYAMKAVERGSTTIAITCQDGVIFLSPSVTNEPLIEKRGTRKMAYITQGIILTYAGLAHDARVLINRAYSFASSHYLKYGENISALELTNKMSTILQQFTQHKYLRPFGVSLLIAGFDSNKSKNDEKDIDQYSLYKIDPSGAFSKWNACVVGKDSEKAIEYLESFYQTDKSITDCLKIGLEALQFQNEKQNIHNGKKIDVCIMTPGDNKPIFKEGLYITSALNTVQEILSKISK